MKCPKCDKSGLYKYFEEYLCPNCLKYSNLTESVSIPVRDQNDHWRIDD